jgi:hypothetical protein
MTRGAVTVNQKTISRRSFSQVVHIGGEHNFSHFGVASGGGIQRAAGIGDFL